MVSYKHIRLRVGAQDPARPNDSLALIDVYTTDKGYTMVCDDGLITITHTTTGNSVDVPYGAMLWGMRVSVPAAEGKKGRKP